MQDDLRQWHRQRRTARSARMLRERLIMARIEVQRAQESLTRVLELSDSALTETLRALIAQVEQVRIEIEKGDQQDER